MAATPPGSQQALLPPRRQFVPVGRVRRRDVDVERPQRAPARVANLVRVAALVEKERPLAEEDLRAVHDRFAGPAHDIEPLVGPAMAVVRPALGLAGAERHLGRLRVLVPEHDTESGPELEVLVAHESDRNHLPAVNDLRTWVRSVPPALFTDFTR